MVGMSIARGFRTALREWRLALLLWMLGLVMALAVTGPVLAWWGGATAYSPEANRMLGGLNMGVLTELVVNQRGGWPLLFGLLVATALLARVLQAFVLGGIVEVLRRDESVESQGLARAATAWDANTPRVEAARDTATEPVPVPRISPTTVAAIDDEPRLALADLEGEAPVDTTVEGAAVRVYPTPEALVAPAATVAAVATSERERRSVVAGFFRGGGRFFLRNLVMLVFTGLGIVIVASLLRLLGVQLVKPLEGTNTEALAWVHGLLPLALGALGAAFFFLAFDYACIRLAAENNRRPVRTWLSALGFVARRFVPALALWVVPGLVVLAAALVYLQFRNALPVSTSGLIVLMIVLQQLFLVLRAIVRTATVAGEMTYASARGFIAR